MVESPPPPDETPWSETTPDEEAQVYPELGIDLARTGAEDKLLFGMEGHRIYRTTYNGVPCLIRRGDHGVRPTVMVLVKAGTYGDLETGQWRVLELIREETRGNQPAKDRLRDVFTAWMGVIRAEAPRKAGKLKRKSVEDGPAQALADFLRDHLGAENIHVEQVNRMFVVKVSGTIRYPYRPSLFWHGLHDMLKNLAQGSVVVRQDTSDTFEAEYNGVPYRETGKLLRLLNKEEGLVPSSRSTHGPVELEVDYEASRGEFAHFELKIIF